ncbi:hypothetical protein TRIUR3_06119 [Triticum urartu]|uniref:Uncharacterized protein n=1 Tax=Triticum urartu TaxID=4572 RepID=M7Z5B1_TRIUA|nr:hypothetical protein TRIUR3_06119 [Triticum urartu]
MAAMESKSRRFALACGVLSQFFEKRKDRLGARAPYARPAAPVANKGSEDKSASSSSWLGLASADGAFAL